MRGQRPPSSAADLGVRGFSDLVIAAMQVREERNILGSSHILRDRGRHPLGRIAIDDPVRVDERAGDQTPHEENGSRSQPIHSRPRLRAEQSERLRIRIHQLARRFPRVLRRADIGVHEEEVEQILREPGIELSAQRLVVIPFGRAMGHFEQEPMRGTCCGFIFWNCSAQTFVSEDLDIANTGNRLKWYGVHLPLLRESKRKD